MRDQTLHADKRRVGLALTPQAERLIDDVRKLRTDWLAKRIGSLPAESQSVLGHAVAALQLLAN
jgi:DNA-binding MarR family transcriptional regulator